MLKIKSDLQNSASIQKRKSLPKCLEIMKCRMCLSVFAVSDLADRSDRPISALAWRAGTFSEVHECIATLNRFVRTSSSSRRPAPFQLFFFLDLHPYGRGRRRKGESVAISFGTLWLPFAIGARKGQQEGVFESVCTWPWKCLWSVCVSSIMRVE